MESCKISLFLCHKRPSLLSIEIDERAVAGGRKERTRQEEEKKTVEGKADNGARREGGREGGRKEGRKREL